MCNPDGDTLYQKFLNEKRQLEQYGRVSSIDYEEWLTIKGYKNERH